MKILSLFTLIVILTSMARATDHIDGPATLKNGQSDLADLYFFPALEGDGDMSVALTLYPFVTKKAHFDTKVKYLFTFRETDLSTGKVKLGDEVTISCRVADPHHKYEMTCESSNGLTSKAKYEKKSKGDFKLYFGMNSDPMFIDFLWLGKVMKGKPKTPKLFVNNHNSKLNILSIVMKINPKKLFPDSRASAFSLVATSRAKDAEGIERQIDRLGRPEVTNMTLNGKDDQDFRDRFNKISPFNKDKDDLSYFKTKLEDRLSAYDAADSKQDRTDEENSELAQVILDDFLVLDMDPSKSCYNDSYFKIEKNLLRKRTPRSCGGRSLNADVFDFISTLYINNFEGGKFYSDLVNGPYRKTSRVFPYLAKPDLSVSAQLKAKAFKKLGPLAL